jgi:F-type H+-transporting ATPase subunit beta
MSKAAANFGVIVAVRGSVVDIRFDEHLPPIYSVLHAGAHKQIVIEVLAQQNARHVRGIALTPTQGLARGMTVEDTGGPLTAPVGKATLSRMFDVFGNTIDRGAALSGLRPRWRAVPPNRKSLKQASKSSMSCCRWSAAARPDCSAGPESARPCC